MTRRDQVGQLLGANPIVGLWLVVVLLGLLSMALHAQEPGEDLTMKCPAACRQIEYNSVAWYVECYPLPRRCSANPEELTLTERLLLLLIDARVIR